MATPYSGYDSNRVYVDTPEVTRPTSYHRSFDLPDDSDHSDSSDSEIEKDFAPPSKRLKGYGRDSFVKGHSTDPFPKDEYDKALAKLKDLITNVASFTNREIFDMWRAMWEITYISKEEEDARFRIFEKSIVDEPRTQEEDLFIALDKDNSHTLSKKELREYGDGTLTEIFIERVFDEHVRRGKSGGGNVREMDLDGFFYFVLALENKDTPEGLTYLFRCLDLQGRGYLTTADIHSLFRDVHRKWIEGGNYELCIEDVRDEIWDMVKPADDLKITLADLLACKQGGTVASMLIDVRGFWAHDNRENLLQEEEEPEDE